MNEKKYRNEIENELVAVEQIIEIASRIKENSKAVIEALSFAFELQTEKGYPNKALIFTAKRTQKYLMETLEKSGL